MTLICVRTSMYFLNFSRGRYAAVEKHARSLAVVERLDLPPDIVDFQQSQDDVDQRDQPEAQRGVDAAGNVLRRAQQPRDVEMFGPQPGDRDAVTVEPCHHGVIKRLVARDVSDQ